jgi:hypothetical protein
VPRQLERQALRGDTIVHLSFRIRVNGRDIVFVYSFIEIGNICEHNSKRITKDYSSPRSILVKYGTANTLSLLNMSRIGEKSPIASIDTGILELGIESLRTNR